MYGLKPVTDDNENHYIKKPWQFATNMIEIDEYFSTRCEGVSENHIHINTDGRGKDLLHSQYYTPLMAYYLHVCVYRFFYDRSSTSTNILQPGWEEFMLRHNITATKPIIYGRAVRSSQGHTSAAPTPSGTLQGNSILNRGNDPQTAADVGTHTLLCRGAAQDYSTHTGSYVTAVIKTSLANVPDPLAETTVVPTVNISATGEGTELPLATLNKARSRVEQQGLKIEEFIAPTAEATAVPAVSASATIGDEEDSSAPKYRYLYFGVSRSGLRKAS